MENSNQHIGQVTLTGIATQAQFDHFSREMRQLFKALEEKITDPEEWLTTKEACTYLKVGTTKLHNLANSKTINKYYLGGGVRYNKNELREVIYND